MSEPVLDDGPGVPPGFTVLDEEWTTVVNAKESRAVVQVAPEDCAFVCFLRTYRVPDPLKGSNKHQIHFQRKGLVVTWADAERWLCGENPEMLAMVSG